MRLISNFHDYYDGGLSWGQEKSVFYNRQSEEIEKSPINFTESFDNYWWNGGLLADDYVIGCCGKIYGMLVLYKAPEKHEGIFSIAAQQKAFEARKVFCYSVEDVDEFVESEFDDKQKKYYYEKGKKEVSKYGIHFYFSNYKCRNAPRRAYVQEFFDQINSKKNAYQDFFLEKQVPIFVCYPKPSKGLYHKMILNDNLGQFRFQKVFDPVLAFQELSMYLGGVASPEKKIPHVSDSDLITAKGFDKWSFRKEPSV